MIHLASIQDQASGLYYSRAPCGIGWFWIIPLPNPAFCIPPMLILRGCPMKFLRASLYFRVCFSGKLASPIIATERRNWKSPGSTTFWFPVVGQFSHVDIQSSQWGIRKEQQRFMSSHHFGYMSHDVMIYLCLL